MEKKASHGDQSAKAETLPTTDQVTWLLDTSGNPMIWLG